MTDAEIDLTVRYLTSPEHMRLQTETISHWLTLPPWQRPRLPTVGPLRENPSCEPLPGEPDLDA
jgi:hypothetical protein